MPYPPVTLSYQYDVGRNIGTTYSGVFLGVKDAWLAMPLNPPTVKGSSNGSVAAMDGVDRWQTADDMMGSTTTSGPRAWLVIRTAAGSELLFDVVNPWASGNVPIYTILFSGSAGFTGGTITARPTATDEAYAQQDSTWQTFDANGAGTRLQLLHSADGRETRMIITSATGIMGGYMHSWCIGELSNTPSALPRVPFWMLDSFFPPGGDSLYNLQVNDRGCMLGVPYAGRRGRLALEGRRVGPPMGLQERSDPNAFSEKWPMTPLWLHYIGNPLSGPISLLGKIKDTWAGSPANPTGTGYLDDGVRRFAQFGNLVVPWNDSVIAVAVP